MINHALAATTGNGPLDSSVRCVTEEKVNPGSDIKRRRRRSFMGGNENGTFSPARTVSTEISLCRNVPLITRHLRYRSIRNRVHRAYYDYARFSNPSGEDFNWSSTTCNVLGLKEEKNKLGLIVDGDMTLFTIFFLFESNRKEINFPLKRVIASYNRIAGGWYYIRLHYITVADYLTIK